MQAEAVGFQYLAPEEKNDRSSLYFEICDWHCVPVPQEKVYMSMIDWILLFAQVVVHLELFGKTLFPVIFRIIFGRALKRVRPWI